MNKGNLARRLRIYQGAHGFRFLNPTTSARALGLGLTFPENQNGSGIYQGAHGFQYFSAISSHNLHARFGFGIDGCPKTRSLRHVPGRVEKPVFQAPIVAGKRANGGKGAKTEKNGGKTSPP